MPAKPAAIWVSEDIAYRLAPVTAEQRDVLPGRVQHDLDVRVSEHVGKRLVVEVLCERVEQMNVAVPIRAVDRYLNEAEQRLVTALTHELGVDAEPPGGA